MLRNVLVDYLDNIRERDFDLPLLALLSAAGYYDIHFTHGQVEYGKDIIAKRNVEGVETQFSFQSKAGDITLADWRNNIMGQMLELIHVGLSHPSFSRSLPHQAVLVCTGRLTGNVSLALQELNAKVSDIYHLLPIELWDQETLLELLERHGLEGVYNSTAAGYVSYGNFYILYGKCLQGAISHREIEHHSHQWIDESIEPDRRLLVAAIESEILAQKCSQQGCLYEASFAHMGALRAIALQIQIESSENRLSWLLDVYRQAKQRLQLSYRTYITRVRQSWLDAEMDLVRLTRNTGSMITYLVHCARIIEAVGFLYFLESNEADKANAAEFLREFMTREPGCTHPPSDRYAVSLILPIIALLDSGLIDTAREMLRRATIWLCDRHQDGFGLAPLESSEQQEISTLLGYPFSFVATRATCASFLATVLCDLAALTDSELYSVIVNDTKACNIAMQYWQAQDTTGLFRFDGDDVITYPNIEYSDTLSRFDAYDFAEHITAEPRAFRIVQIADPVALMAVMLLLRDRYFPTVWPLLIRGRAQ